MFISLVLVLASVCIADAELQSGFRRLSVGSGSIHSAITGIVQDQTGFLWASTRYGLYKFDGYDFSRISILDEQGTVGVIRQLEATGDGFIWVRIESGEVINVDPRTNESELVEFSSDVVTSELIVDSSGGIWAILSDSKLYQFEPEGQRFEQRDFTFQGSGISILNFFSDDSYYYFNTLEAPQMLRCEKGDSVCEIAEFGDEVEIWLLKDCRGHYWGRGRGGGIVMMEADEVALLSDRDTLVEEIVEDENGGIWIGTSAAGLHHYPSGQLESIALTHDAADPESIPSNTVEELWADNSGNVWVGTRNGFAMLNTRPSMFSFVEVDPGLSERRNVMALFIDNQENLWAGIEDNGLFRRDNDSWVRVADGSVRDSVLAIEQSSDGDLLLATSGGLFQFDPASGAAQRMSEPVHVSDVLVTRSGDIWITTLLQGYGKFDIASNRFGFFRPAGLLGGRVGGITATALAEDGAGNIWIGFDGHGLIRLAADTGNYIQFRDDGQSGDSLSSESVNCVYIDHRDHIWVGTSNGLNRIDPNTNAIEQYFIADGLPDNFICSIASVDTDALWISTRAGLARFSVSDQQIAGFDSDAGLESSIFVVRSGGVAKQGALFFGGFGGITSVDTQLQLDAIDAPDTVIASLSVFGNPVAPGQLRAEGALIKIPHDQNIFSIEFATMDFTRPSANRFKYRLKGLEDQFSSVSNSHIARYSKVQPGNYTFEVFGTNSNGTWSDKPATIRVLIMPPFWMTWQFRALATFTVIALTFGLYKWRTTAIMRQRDRLQTEVIEREIVERRLLSNRERLRSMASELILAEDRERRRVALILHDQIAQSLIISKTRLDTAMSNLPESKETIEFNKVSSILNDTIKDTRSLTAEVSPPSLHRFGLEVAVKSLLDRYGAEHGLETAIIHEAKTDLSKDLSVLLYRSIRELLINIIKHSRAKTVVVEIRQKKEHLSVMVQDDGRGFDSAATLSDESAPKGFGLFSIQERIESLGGKFKIESDAEHGTLIIIEVPISGSAAEQ